MYFVFNLLEAWEHTTALENPDYLAIKRLAIEEILRKEDEADEVWVERTNSVILREEEDYELYG